MKPVVTVEHMRAVDAAAEEPVEALVARAGSAVARSALSMLGGAYGRRVVVVAGKGKNGADGRVAGERLRRRGVRVAVFDAGDGPERLPPCDLVVDAAYGTGFRGEYRAPDPRGAPVLAVDIPSGVNGDTGEWAEGAVRAGRTVTFAALKPGLLLGGGPDRAGIVQIADIGLDVSATPVRLVEDADIAARLPRRSRDSHKWQSAVHVVAGSHGMLGAALLTSTAAMRAGAGTARLSTPGAARGDYPASEVVGRPVPAEGWAGEVLSELGRSKALVVGPGLGTAAATAESVRQLVSRAPVPVVVDADGLNCLAGGDLAGIVAARRHPTVLTPHAGEFARLAGRPVGADRIRAALDLAGTTGAFVLLKGSTTVVAAPGGEVLMSATGDGRLATAGTGDVLAGMIAAFLASGLGPLEAAAFGAHAHGAAGRLGPEVGLLAGDLLGLLPRWLSWVLAGGAPPAAPPPSLRPQSFG